MLNKLVKIEITGKKRSDRLFKECEAFFSGIDAKNSTCMAGDGVGPGAAVDGPAGVGAAGSEPGGTGGGGSPPNRAAARAGISWAMNCSHSSVDWERPILVSSAMA